MPSLRKPRQPYRHAILVSLIAIVTPTLVLLYLGIHSVLRQREAIATLSVSNLRLSGEKVVAELERRTRELADACLQNEQLAELAGTAARASTPERLRQARMLAEKLSQQHPLARHFFVLEGGVVRFPLARAFPRRSLDQDLSELDATVGREFEQLFHQAEEEELERQRPDVALAVYRRGYALPVTDSLKALALSRMARCLRKLHRTEDVQRAYLTLRDSYGDTYDPFYRPYAVVASLELDDPDPKELEALSTQVLGGRWELSADQVKYFLGLLEDRLEGREADDRWRDSHYLRHLALAQSLHESFRHRGPLLPNQTYSYAFVDAAADHQLFYQSVSLAGGRDVIAGFSVDLDWTKSKLLPLCAREAGEETQDVDLVAAESPPSDQELDGQSLAFSALFPFWELRIRPVLSEPQATTARREILIFSGVVALVLSVLGLGVFLMLRDASRELKMAEVRGDFVSGVSHELKTPLTLIRLYGETLLHGDELPDKERRGFYRIILRESERLTHLIDTVLDFARIGRGQKDYHLVAGDLARVVSRTVEAYEEFLSRRGFSISIDLEPDLPAIRFDGDAVTQAVVNLIDNAVKYSGDSRYVGVGVCRRSDEVVLQVEDHGVGVAPAEREKIFQQFYRPAGYTGKGGSGLGLFLVKHIMDAHGGSIELDSEIGRGSVFRLVFPMHIPSPSVGELS